MEEEQEMDFIPQSIANIGELFFSTGKLTLLIGKFIFIKTQKMTAEIFTFKRRKKFDGIPLKETFGIKKPKILTPKEVKALIFKKPDPDDPRPTIG